MEDIQNCISFLIGKAAQSVTRATRDLLDPYNITPIQYAALHQLGQQDGLSSADLCSLLVLDSATITGVVDRLNREGLIERRPDQQDRRINRLYLTDKARDLLPDLEVAIDHLNAAFDSYMAGQGDQARALIAKIASFPPLSQS